MEDQAKTQPPAPETPVPVQKSPRFDFLDGLRGLAALYVALYHTSLFTGRTADHYEEFAGSVYQVTQHGRIGVPAFIVISGFCLALPLFSGTKIELRGGFKGFIARRSRRLLPPYYAALVLFIAAIALIPAATEVTGTAWDNKVPVDTRAVVTHGLLIHNLDSESIYKVDGPMWSVATEWQIYLVFGLLLVPVWRRFGVVPTVGLAVAMALIPPLLLDADFYGPAHLWFIGSFAMGMWAAQAVRTRNRLLYGHTRLIGFGAAGLLCVGVLSSDATRLVSPSFEVIASALMACVIAALAASARPEGNANVFLRFLQSRPVALLGLMSYSLYLIHSPILGITNVATLDWSLSITQRTILMCVVVLPAAVLASYVFHRLVERRFMTTHMATALDRAHAKN